MTQRLRNSIAAALRAASHKLETATTDDILPEVRDTLIESLYRVTAKPDREARV